MITENPPRDEWRSLYFLYYSIYVSIYLDMPTKNALSFTPPWLSLNVCVFFSIHYGAFTVHLLKWAYMLYYYDLITVNVC